MDTRSPGTIGPRSTQLLSGVAYTFPVRGTNGRCTIPADATGVVMNATVLPGVGHGYLSIYPGDTGSPASSNTNWTAAQPVVANQVTAQLAADGSLTAFVAGTPANLVLDVAAYMVPAAPVASSTTTSSTTTTTAFASRFGTNTNLAGAGRGDSCTVGEIFLTATRIATGIPANGQITPIASYPALFSLYGTTFGGDSVTTFRLPDLRNVAPNGLTYSVCVAGVFPANN